MSSDLKDGRPGVVGGVGWAEGAGSSLVSPEFRRDEKRGREGMLWDSLPSRLPLLQAQRPLSVPSVKRLEYKPEGFDLLTPTLP